MAQALRNRSFTTLAPSFSISQSRDYGYVSDYVLAIFQVVNFLTICELIDVVGTATNIINIMCFVKQGFKDSVNVNLLGLAVSDLGSLVILLWHNICYIPLFQEANLPFDPLDVQYLTGGWPHVIFTRITSWITAFITIERCLCVMVPLRVKTILTPKRCTIIIICLFVALIACVSPLYYSTRLDWVFFSARNKTLIGLVFTADHKQVDRVVFTINNIFIPFSAFITVIIATALLVVTLKSKTAWRQQSTAPGNSDSSSSRDQRVSKMVVMISTMFIVCFSPICIAFIAVAVEPEFYFGGKYHNMHVIVISFAFILESVNSAMNIFVYYTMSSRYRATFRELFCRRKTKAATL